MDTNTHSNTNSNTSREVMSDGQPVNPLEQLIQNVAKRADITETSAEHVVDMVLTSVKRKLPNPMAERLVAVMSGEDDYANSGGTAGRRSDTLRGDNISETIGEVGGNITRVGGRVFEDATRLGGKAFEEAGHVSRKVAGEAVDVADKLSRWAKDAINKPKN